MARELPGLVALAFDPVGFEKYMRTVVAPRMAKGVWRPTGVTLHNTGLHSRWTEATSTKDAIQYTRNMSVTWDHAGWSSGPHLVIGPCGNIVIGSPLWARGTHSPSFNATFWGIEMVGDFTKQVFLPKQRDTVAAAMAVMYATLGAHPRDSTFKLHKEDPRTTHKLCPGINSGDKSTWLARIEDAMADISRGELDHVHVA